MDLLAITNEQIAAGVVLLVMVILFLLVSRILLKVLIVAAFALTVVYFIRGGSVAEIGATFERVIGGFLWGG